MRGSLMFLFMRDDQWQLKQAEWRYVSLGMVDLAGHLTEHRFLGFGYEMGPGSALTERFTSLELPTWTVALITSVPPLFLYRSHRKRRKTGFPVEPVAANSKE